MQSLRTFLVICIAVIKANESDTWCREHFKFLVNEVDSVLQNSSRNSQPVSLVCGIKNVTLISSPVLGIQYTLEPGQGVDWKFADCYLDNRTLLFKTDGLPKSRLTYIEAYEVEEVVVTILCVSSSPILFKFEGDLPQWDLIVEHDYNPEKEIYLSTIYIPYMPDKTGKYSFSSSDGEDTKKHYEWFYIFFAGADQFVPNPSRDTTYLPSVMWTNNDDEQNAIIPCRVTDPKLSQFVRVIDSQENVICFPCNISTNGIQISDPIVMAKMKRVDYIICVIRHHHESSNETNTKEIDKRLKVRIFDHGQRKSVSSGGIQKIQIKNEPHLVCLNQEEIEWSNISIVYVPRIAEAELRKNCLEEGYDCSSKAGVPLYGANKNIETCEKGETCSIPVDDYESSGNVRCVSNGGNVTSEVDYFKGLDQKIHFVHDWKLGKVPVSALANISKLANGRIICHVCNYLYMPGFKFKLTYLNGTLQEKYSEAATSVSRFGELHSGSESHNEWLDGMKFSDLKRISCEAKARISIQGQKQQGIEVFAEGEVENGFLPKVIWFSAVKIPNIADNVVFFNCSATGFPKPEISYEKDDKKIKTQSYKNTEWNNTENMLYSSEFVQRNNLEHLYGLYRCVAKNIFGVDSKVQEFGAKDAHRAEKCTTSPHQHILDKAHLEDKSSYLNCSETASFSCSCQCPTKTKKNPDCQCPIPVHISNAEGYILWPTFSVGDASRLAKTDELCYLTGSIDCTDANSESCSTTLTSEIEGFRTNKALPVDKRWIKPIRQSYDAYENKTDAARVCSIQRTIGDTLCLIDPNREIEQTMVGSGLQLLFPLVFEDLHCSCTAKIRKGRPLNVKTEEMEHGLTWYATGFASLGLILAVFIVGSLLYTWHLKRKTTLELAQNIVVGKDSGEPALGTEMAKIKSKPKNETTIWISPQPLELLSTTPLGCGYYGKVYKAQHTLLDEPMAIKHILLYKALQACSWNVDLLLREIKHLRQVEHANVVKFYHCWIEGPEGMVGLVESMGISQWTSTNENYSFFIQMEFCDGTLDVWLKSTERQTEDENITSIFRQVLQGLDAIHRKDIVHRDIKPNNVFWKMEGNGKKIWKIGDLGLSKKMGVESENDKHSDEDDELSHVGNENYKSPEMSRELNYTYKTDIYSLGLVFLEILLPELINTGKKVAVFKEIRESENLGSYLPLLLGSPGPISNKENCIPKNETLYEILEGMLNSVPEFRLEIHEILKLLGD